MKIKTQIPALVLSFLVACASTIYGDDKNAPAPIDTFSLDGQSIITAPEHLGIINGKLTLGTPYGQVARIQGLWAPPYVSSDFALSVNVFGKEVSAQSYKWWPFKVERRGEVDGVKICSATVLAANRRGGILAITLNNTTQKTLEVPLTFHTQGTLDRCDFWEFSGAVSSTPAKPTAEQATLTLTANDLAIVLQGTKDALEWDAESKVGKQNVTLKPGESDTIYLAFAMDKSLEAKTACEAIAADPAKALAEADNAHAKQVETISQRLPRFTSCNKDLEKYYNRSLVHFITNRWDVPEFVLQPYYSTGSIRGGCVCDYLWNYGELWEIMPIYDPAAHREHIKQFLKCDMTTHFSFNPIDGKAFGPWYMVNQEKILGLVYYYVKNTGDVAFLDEVVDGKTVLEHVLKNAVVLDDVSKPVALIDYGPSNSHLELRRRADAYNHVMPDLNGRRYANYIMAARLADVAGKPASLLRDRAEALKKLLKAKLWNPKTKWFDFINGQGESETCYTVQMFKLFGSPVLDDELESGLMSHLNEDEFLSEHGLHSLAKGDPEYDTNDVDNGGPGACTCFPPQIVERLYKAGRPEVAEDIMRRCLWWGEKMPYWGDSIVAERADYRHDTPLQCTVDGVTVAQSIIFGLFGIDAQFDGTIRIHPAPPTYASQIALQGVKLRGLVFDVDVADNKFKVSAGGKTQSAPVGQTILITKDGQLEVVKNPQKTGEF